jgi:hypothetical protein
MGLRKNQGETRRKDKTMGIQIIRQSTAVGGLADRGAVPLSQPACRMGGIDVTIPGREACSTGIWECTPGRFQRQIPQGEVMHFLAGACSFTPDRGQALAICAGDTLFFSPDATGVWDVRETVRKVYVLV